MTYRNLYLEMYTFLQIWVKSLGGNRDFVYRKNTHRFCHNRLILLSKNVQDCRHVCPGLSPCLSRIVTMFVQDCHHVCPGLSPCLSRIVIMFVQDCHHVCPGLSPGLSRIVAMFFQDCRHVCPGLLPCLSRIVAMFVQDCCHVCPGLSPCLYRIVVMFVQDCHHVCPGLSPCLSRIVAMFVQDCRHVCPGLSSCLSRIVVIFIQDCRHICPGLSPCLSRIVAMFVQDCRHVCPGLSSCLSRIVVMFVQDCRHICPGLSPCLSRIVTMFVQDCRHVCPGLSPCLSRIVAMFVQDCHHVCPGLSSCLSRIVIMFDKVYQNNAVKPTVQSRTKWQTELMAKPAKWPSTRLSAIPSVIQRVHQRPATSSCHQQFHLRRWPVPYHPTEDVRTGGDYTRQRTKRAGRVLWREPKKKNHQADRKLNVTWNGTKLDHTHSPVYPGITLDRSLTYRNHCLKTHAKLSSRNNLLRKPHGTNCGACPHTMRTTATALCLSVAEYCCPVWARSMHRKLVDTMLNETCRLITGCIRPTDTPDLYMLSGIAPPEIRSSVHCQNERTKQLTDQRTASITTSPWKAAYAHAIVSSQPPSLSCVSPQKLVSRSGKTSGRLPRATWRNMTSIQKNNSRVVTHCRGEHGGRPTECARDRLPPRQRNICGATVRTNTVCAAQPHAIWTISWRAVHISGRYQAKMTSQKWRVELCNGWAPLRTRYDDHVCPGLLSCLSRIVIMFV